MGMIPVLFLIFLTLKLTGCIDWPWVAVCSPIIALIVFYAFALIIGIYLNIKRIDE
jgi:hypothetical protein